MGGSFQHTAVLPQAVIELLDPRPGGIYVDATLGGGSHATLLLERAGPGATLLGIDADPAALAAAGERLATLAPSKPPQRIVLAHGNFRGLAALAGEAGIAQADGILFDLGVSSHQLDTPERGFSFNVDAPLDMRLDPAQGPGAADLLNSLPEQELADIFYRYGEERASRRIARWIVERRQKQPFSSTAELASLVSRALGGQRGRIHPATRTFQALRIAVNGELDSLAAVLPQAVELLAPGGRLAVISFHSLEDRIVKHFIRGEARLRALTKKPLEADEAEVAANPRARSAKLRVAERV